MSCGRWVVSASGIACKRNWKFVSASPTFQRVVENIERGKRALVSLKIHLESCINEQLKTNPPEMIRWWSYDYTEMNCVRVKCLVFLIPIYFCSIRETFRATRRLFRTMEEKIEVCNGHLPSDCVDKTWFPGSRIASDCNVYFHLLPSIHFTLKQFCNGTWISKAILFNFLLKILQTFRFPIHSERTAGNRRDTQTWQTKVALNSDKALLCWGRYTWRDIFDPSACAWVYCSHTQRGAGEWKSPKSRPFGWGKNKLHGFDPLFLLVDSSGIHFFYDNFPRSVTIHNLTITLAWDYSICKCLPGLNFTSVRFFLVEKRELEWDVEIESWYILNLVCSMQIIFIHQKLQNRFWSFPTFNPASGNIMKNLHYHPLHIVGISYYTMTLMLLVTKGYKQSCVAKKVPASTIAERLKKLLRKINCPPGPPPHSRVHPSNRSSQLSRFCYSLVKIKHKLQ